MAMERELLEHKAFLSPIRALPQEILGYIFLFYVEDSSSSPWTLMQVTRNWRATALSTRAIWAKIMLTSPAWRNSGASRRMGGREVCGNKEQLDRALRRAGNAPLDITFALTNPYGNRGQKYDKIPIWEMVNHLISSGSCSRVRHLEINGPYSSNLFWDRHLQPLPSPKPLLFPNLVTLSIDTSLPRDFMAGILTTSRQIKEVRLQLPAEPYTPFGIEEILRFPSMVSLSLDVSHAMLVEGNADKLRSVLDGAAFIQALKTCGISTSSGASSSSTLRLPTLRTLFLSGESKMWPLNAPRLTHLTLCANSFITAGPAESNHFPFLASLTVDACHSVPNLPDFLGHMHFPPLHTLDVCFGRNVSRMAVFMAHRSKLNPVVFKLRGTVTTTARLTGMLQHMDRLKDLQFDGVPLKKDFFDFLASRKATCGNSGSLPSPESQFYFPLLVKFQAANLMETSSGQSKHLRAAAKQAIQARVKAGIVVEKWLIQFSGEKGWSDDLA